MIKIRIYNANRSYAYNEINSKLKINEPPPQTRILSFRSLLSHITNMLHLFVYHSVPVSRTRDEDYNRICV